MLIFLGAINIAVVSARDYRSKKPAFARFEKSEGRKNLSSNVGNQLLQLFLKIVACRRVLRAAATVCVACED